MKRSRFALYAAVWSVAVAFTGYVTHQLFSVSLPDLGIVIASAVAAPIFGIVFFDFKAFSRAAALAGNMVLARLGFRPSGVGSLSRPHGL